MTRVAVLGASGLSGAYVLTALRERGVDALAITRQSANRERLLTAGASEVVVADYADAGALTSALDGVEGVYLIPPALDADEDRLAGDVIAAAQAAGVTRFVYVSVIHPGTPALAHHVRKGRAEAALRESTLEWTILQPGMYAQMVWRMFGQAPAGEVAVPFDPESVFTVLDLRDLAEVGVAALLEPGHAYATYELAADTQTMTSMVRTAGELRGVALEPVRRDPAQAPVPPQYGPAAAADMRAMFAEYDRHGLRGNPNVLTGLLGRAPFSFADAARAALADRPGS